MTCIYLIKSKLNPSRIYVGSSVSYINRKRQHLRMLNNNVHYNKRLQNHFNKYNDLCFEVYKEVEIKSNLIKEEQKAIDKLNPYFNICKVAGSPLGVKWTKEQKKEQSNRLIGNKNSLGYKHTIFTKQKLSNIRKGNKNAQGNKGNKIKDYQIDALRKRRSKLVLDTYTGIYYNSAKELCDLKKLNYSTIIANLNGQNINKTSYIFV
jgi:group I intron endonuclease